MKKYLWVFAVLLLISVFVTCEKEKHTQNANIQSQVCSGSTVAGANTIKAESNDKNAKGNLPSWLAIVVYRIFGFPEGITVWALFLTLAVIAEQAREMQRQNRNIVRQSAILERQTKATEDTVLEAAASRTLAEDTAKRQLRAYLCVSQARLNFRDDSQIKAQIEIENTGQTPAFEVRTWVDSTAREHPLLSPLHPPHGGLVQSNAIIGPGEHHTAVTNPLYGKEIDFERVWNPSHAFYVYGECSYRDIFKKRHILSFRMIFGGPAQINIRDDADGVRFGMLSMDIAGNEERDED